MRYLTVSEFAKLPQIRRTTRGIRVACAAGKIPGAFRVYEGGAWRIPESAIPGPPPGPKPRTKKDVARIVAETIALCDRKRAES